MPPKKAKKTNTTRRSVRKLKAGGPKTSLLDLPLEVRDMIYGILLTDKCAIEPKVSCAARDNGRGYCRTHGNLCRPSSCGMQPQILRVNRQINEEALRILYGRNTFRFTDDHGCCPHPYEDMSLGMDSEDEEYYSHSQEVHDFKLFLIDIGPENRMFLRKLEFCFSRKEVLGRGHHVNHMLKAGRFMGKSFADGFRLLSNGHSIQSLQVRLTGCKLSEEMECRQELLNAMAKVKNVPNLQIVSDCEYKEDGPWASLTRVRRTLVTGSASVAHKTTADDKISEVTFDYPHATEDALAKQIQKLSSEKRVLGARIAEDTEREKFIENMLKKAKAAISL